MRSAIWLKVREGNTLPGTLQHLLYCWLSRIMSLADAFKAVQGYVMRKMDNYEALGPEDVTFSVDDLPVKKVDGKTTHLTACVEIVGDVDEPDFDSMVQSMADLPPPFQAPPDSQVQYYTSPIGYGKVVLVKLLSFGIRTSLKLIQDHAVGEIYSMAKVPNQAPSKLQMVIHYMGRRLGGYSLTNLHIEGGRGVTATRTPDELKRGFVFIREMGPLGTDENQNIEWAESSA